MFFFLSKVLYYAVMPFTIVCAAFLYSGITKVPRRKRIAFWTALTMLLFFSNDFLANEVMRAWEIEARPIASLKKYKLAIVLTGTTMSNVPDDRVYFTKGADRVTHTIQLFKEGKIERILISGGSGRIMGEAEPEANKFRKVMVMMGVPDSVILIENETRNTAESAQEVKKVLDESGFQGSDCVLITSAFHMRRSLACYRKVGIELDCFSTDFYSYPRDYTIDAFVVPKLESFLSWQKLVKEWVGFVAYKAAGYV
ncbi:MAG TPA: YdcF family protein [Chryseosolibacter sp.]